MWAEENIMGAEQKRVVNDYDSNADGHWDVIWPRVWGVGFVPCF